MLKYVRQVIDMTIIRITVTGFVLDKNIIKINIFSKFKGFNNFTISYEEQRY